MLALQPLRAAFTKVFSCKNVHSCLPLNKCYEQKGYSHLVTLRTKIIYPEKHSLMQQAGRQVDNITKDTRATCSRRDHQKFV
jgi:hypothetical protein